MEVHGIWHSNICVRILFVGVVHIQTLLSVPSLKILVSVSTHDIRGIEVLTLSYCYTFEHHIIQMGKYE